MESVAFHLRLSKSVHERLKEDAARARRSVAGWAAILIEDALDGKQEPAPAPAPVPIADPTILAMDAAETIKRELKQRGVKLGSEEQNLRQILPSFPNVRDVETARAEGWRAWVEKRAGSALITKLFLGDDEAIRLADRAILDRRNADRHWEKYGGVAPWYAPLKLKGQAAGAAAKVPVKTVAEAQALGEAELLRLGMSKMSVVRVMNATDEKP